MSADKTVMVRCSTDTVLRQAIAHQRGIEGRIAHDDEVSDWASDRLEDAATQLVDWYTDCASKDGAA